MSLKTLAAAMAVLALATPVAAQSLAEIAERTKKKRQAEKAGSTKVITESDLGGNSRGTYSPGAGEPVVGSTAAPESSGDAAPAAQPAAGAETSTGGESGGEAAPAPAASPAAPAAPTKTDEELAAERQADWRDRRTKAQAEVDHWTKEADRLQLGLNDNTGPLYGPGRAARQNALDEVKAKLAAAQQTLEALGEEGRRNGYR